MGSRVVCHDCGRTDSFPAKRCRCGEPLWFESGSLAPPGDGSGLRRFADRLPADPTGLGAVAGDTPLVRADRLDGYAGCRLSLKLEGANPTGSFKDRGSAVGVAWAAERGREWVGTVSHGNMAMSMAATAAAAGLDCLVLVPADLPEARLARLARYGPSIVRVAGDYGRLYRDALSLGPDLGVEFVSSDTPLRVAGQRTVAFEIGAKPDALVLPASSGGHASAVWKGLRELAAAGRTDDLPRLYLVQAAACDPIAAAYREGRSTVRAVEAGETVAYSIANGDPPSGNRALAAVRATGGAAVSVGDGSIREARARLADRAGVDVEHSSAAALAGLRELAERGAIRPDEDVTLIATGTGFAEAGDASVEAPTVRRGDLGERLGPLVGA